MLLLSSEQLTLLDSLFRNSCTGFGLFFTHSYKGVKGGRGFRSRFKENRTVLSQFTKNRHNENHGSQRINHSFLVSWKIILQNHASCLLWKSRFPRKKEAISHFTGKKRADYESRKYPLLCPHSLIRKFRARFHLGISTVCKQMHNET